MSPIRPEEKTRYPADWDDISARIKHRATWRCECVGECGRGTHEGRCPNVHAAPAYGTGSKVVLTTAHLNHTPEDCHPENLRAMCQGCHLHYDREHHAETRAVSARPRRIQLLRRKGWRLPDGAVSCARPHRYSNPFIVGTPKNGGNLTREQAVESFRVALREGRLQFSEAEVRRELAGKDLGCFCRLDQRCHVDVLLDVANGRRTRLSTRSTEPRS